MLVFSISSVFGHFNDPLTIPRYLKRTFNMPPKNTILGFLGAILGFKGYSSMKDYPEFFEILKDVKMYIFPKKIPFKKIVLEYNSLNSFANNSTNIQDLSNPNIIMKEELLINPSYEIGIYVENEDLYNKFLYHFNNRTSEYHLYMGKNEFFLNFDFLGEFSFDDVEYNNIFVNSIFPLEVLDENIEEIDEIILDDFLSEMEFFPEEKIVRGKPKKVGFLKSEEKIRIKESELKNFKKVNNKIVYLF